MRDATNENQYDSFILSKSALMENLHHHLMPNGPTETENDEITVNSHYGDLDSVYLYSCVLMKSTEWICTGTLALGNVKL